MKISILIPCYNEEKSIYRAVKSCLDQTREPDEVVVVDDGSTDNTLKILESFNGRLKVVRNIKNSGNKSYAQETGIKFITGDVFITTDGDTLLDRRFVERVELAFRDPKVAALSGYVKSLKYNWLTAARQIDYIIGQDIHKWAQSLINFLLVIPGAAGAFRTDIFRQYISFDHDTVTEDLDFTYKLNKSGFKIAYDKHAIAYTQDPTDIKSYIKQMKRWYGGGWQNLAKHINAIKKPSAALELSLTYMDGLAFGVMFFVLPIINIKFFLMYALFYIFIAVVFSTYAAVASRRWSLALYAPAYMLITLINALVFIQEFVLEIVLKKKRLVWLKPTRKEII